MDLEMSKTLIEAKNVTLHVPVFSVTERKININPMRLLSGTYSTQTDREVKTLLENISFKLMQGQRMGVLGGNGAGKTTLMRVLSGVYKASGGELHVNGNVQAMFNVQLGMNQAATGIENIYLRGIQMGMSLATIKKKVPEIVEFAGIGDAINNTFSTYSAGMRLRLAVSISTIVSPEILILDEWIGAGDADFQEKLDQRMKEVILDSKALVIATHNKNLMRRYCTHGLVLSKGKSVFFGDLDEALEFYKNQRAAAVKA